MKILIQRVSQARVDVANQTIGKIEQGILALVGFDKHDTPVQLDSMAKKLTSYRIFEDDQGKMNLDVKVCGKAILVVSQFTLAADTQKGLRPSFSSACPPVAAEALYESFVERLKQYDLNIQTGEFGADMTVSLTNDGPVTFLLENMAAST